MQPATPVTAAAPNVNLLNMTPPAAPTPTADGAVNGTSPTAKRPRDRSAYTAMGGSDATTAATRTMTAEEMTQSIHGLMRLQARDEQFAANVGQCTHTNADLLNAVVTRVNAIEAAVKPTPGIVENHDVQLTRSRRTRVSGWRSSKPR